MNLLKLLKDGAVTLADLQTQLQGPLPEAARRHIGRVLDALLVLVAWARSPETGLCLKGSSPSKMRAEYQSEEADAVQRKNQTGAKSVKRKAGLSSDQCVCV